MDWGLVLVSQGIEATIDCSEDGTSWGLMVARPELGRALRALRLYRLENRGWPWQQQVLERGYLFDWGSLAWVLLVILFYGLDARAELRPSGALVGSLVTHGQWWRLFTAIWLHGDVGHLASNATFGFVLLGLAMGRYGTGAGLLAAYLGGVGGNVVSWLVSGELHRSLGASGMVMAGLGLLAAQSLSARPRPAPARKVVLAGIFSGVMLFTLLGLTPGTDVLAHLGGFLNGLLLGGLLGMLPVMAQKAGVNLGCGLLFTVLVVLPWRLALR